MKKTPVPTKKMAIFGAGGQGRELAMLIEQINKKNRRWKLIGFFDDDEPEGKTVNNYPVLGGTETLNKWQGPLNLVLALGMPEVKRSVFSKIDNPNITYPVLIHPSVEIGCDVVIGAGSIVCAGTFITTNVSIGRHVLLNLQCTIAHDAVIGDFSSVMSGCNISGRVKIGKGTFLGAGVKIIERKSVGSNTIVGAGAVVINDIPDNVTAVGVPAKTIKT